MADLVPSVPPPNRKLDRLGWLSDLSYDLADLIDTACQEFEGMEEIMPLASIQAHITMALNNASKGKEELNVPQRTQPNHP